MSTMNLVVDGVPANKWEWDKYNFYPKNDMVGEVMQVRGFNVLKIMDGIYVPMSPLGIAEISAEEYERGEFTLLTLEEYVDIIVSQLELFSEETIIQRLTGDGGKETLIGPLWSLKKFVVLNEIDKEMIRRNTFQGKKFEKCN